MKKICKKLCFICISILIILGFKNNVNADGVEIIDGVEYLKDITYNTTRYVGGPYNNPGTTVYWAIIPKKYEPELSVAKGYSLENNDLEKVELPSSNAIRNNATLAINLGLWHGVIVNDGKFNGFYANKNIEYGDTLYMTRDGILNSISNSRDNGNINDENMKNNIMNLSPALAVSGFFTIAKNNEIIPINEINYTSTVLESLKQRHPRTFVGQDMDGNYFVGVCEGRIDEKELSLLVEEVDRIMNEANKNGMEPVYPLNNYELQAGFYLEEIYDFVENYITKDRGIRIIYNGDGGGSSAFIYKGKKINNIIDKKTVTVDERKVILLDELGNRVFVERKTPNILYWKVNKYQVNYDANSGDGYMPSQEMIVGDTTQLLNAAFMKRGYMFYGWNTKPDGTGKSYANGGICY